MSPNPNFISPRLSEAIHLPGWIPGKGGIKSSKHKQRKREKKEEIVKWENYFGPKKFAGYVKKARKCRRQMNVGEEQKSEDLTKRALYDGEIKK